MTVSFHKYGDMFFPGTGDVKVILYAVLFFFLDSISNNEDNLQISVCVG